jgi:ATP-dependent DNA helicase RecQ
MDDYMTIKEYDAAKILNTHTNEIKKQLNYLKQVGILDYVASIDLPTITFTQPRNFSKYLQLNKKFIESRKEIFEKQLRSMLNYAANKQLCRSKMILEYFGEEGERCGSCDICLELNKMNISELKFENLLNAIKENLMQKPMPLEALTLYISDYSKDNILAMVKWLTDNGQIICNEEKKFIWLH